jgi:hypothetical protein
LSNTPAFSSKTGLNDSVICLTKHHDCLLSEKCLTVGTTPKMVSYNHLDQAGTPDRWRKLRADILAPHAGASSAQCHTCLILYFVTCMHTCIHTLKWHYMGIVNWEYSNETFAVIVKHPWLYSC